MKRILRLFPVRPTLGLTVALGLAVTSGCTIVTSANEANLADGATVEASSAEAVGEDPLLDTGLPFVNTASVLFPMHKMTEEALSEQMESYLNSFVDIELIELTVSRSAYVRSGPGTYYDPVALAPSWTALVVDGKSGSWYRLADGSGYFPTNRLTDLYHPSGIVWEVAVVNDGAEEEIDACLGGLTNFAPMADDLGVPVWSMHGNCGGESAYELEVGDVVAVDGDHYEVISHNLYPLFSSTESMADLVDEEAFIQVCDLVQGYSHIIGLRRTA